MRTGKTIPKTSVFLKMDEDGIRSFGLSFLSLPYFYITESAFRLGLKKDDDECRRKKQLQATII